MSSDLKVAREVASEVLEASLPRRWQHVVGVAARANDALRGPLGLGCELVVATGYLHDIGYAESLLDTGFHPIDGARYLRSLGYDDRAVNLVAHHSCARFEAKFRDLERVLVDEFPYDQSLPHDELCFCDMTTSPDGELVTAQARLAEVRNRYGPDSIVHRSVDLAEDELLAAVRRVEASIAQGTG